jgi:YaiO family outer membrane protein
MIHRCFGIATVLAALVLVSAVQAQDTPDAESSSLIERLTREAEAEHENSDAQVKLGLALMREHRFDEARRAFQKALSLAPNYHDARIGLARIAFFNGDLDAAEKELKEVRDRVPDNVEAKELAEQVGKARQAQAKTPSAGEPAPSPAPRPQQASDAAERLLRQGTADYRAGWITRAVRNLSRAAELQPDNSDIQVQLGSALLAQGRFADARRAFRKGLALAPTYHDARIGLARMALAQGAFGEADRELKAVFKRSPDNADGKVVRAQLDRARAARRQHAQAEASRRLAQANAVSQGRVPEAEDRGDLNAETRPRWRFDLGGSHSDLTGGNEPWREGISRLAYQVDTRTTLSAGVEVSNRFGLTDALIDGRVDQRWAETYTSYLRLGGTPKADFRPQLLAEGGGTIRLANAEGLIGPTLAMLDLGYSRYTDADVGSVSPGIQQSFFGNRFWLTTRFIGTLSKMSAGGSATATERFGGYSVRADAQVTDRLSLFIGYANAPDASDGRVLKTESIFGGAEFALDDSISLLVSAAREDRKNSYDRTSVNLGVAIRF